MGKRGNNDSHAGGGQERRLMVWAFLALASGYFMIVLARLSNSPVWLRKDWLPLGVFAGALLVVHLSRFVSGSRRDASLIVSGLFLSGFGLLAQFRMGTLDFENPSRMAHYAYPAGIFVLVLVAIAFGAGRIRSLESMMMPASLAAIAVLAVIVLLGQRFRGGMFLAGNLNPAELAKPLLVVFAAAFISDYREDLKTTVAGFPAPSVQALLVLAIFWGIPMALLVMQRDMGMLILMNVVLVLMLVMATGRIGYAVLAGLLALPLGYAMFHFLAHGHQRFLAWQDPFRDPTGRGWQILQALSAMFTGGLWGTGLGVGHPQTVPIATSDFVYAALAEEIGFVGCALIMVTYLVFFFRGFLAADRASCPFVQLLAAGLVITLACQTFLNLGGVTKLIPLTGITLPFISQGGSSLVASFLALGLLVAISSDAPGATGDVSKKRSARGKRPARN